MKVSSKNRGLGNSAVMVFFAYSVPLRERVEIKARYDRLGIEYGFMDDMERAAAETLDALIGWDATLSTTVNPTAEGCRKGVE